MSTETQSYVQTLSRSFRLPDRSDDAAIVLNCDGGEAAMAMLAQLYDNGRTAERHALDADATLRGDNQVPVDILIADLFATG